LRAADIGDCIGLYDRAALIALPPAMRAAYMQLLSALLPARCRGLLVTLDYDQSLLAGPPFSVGDEEVRQGLAGWQVDELEAVEVIQESPKFVQAGVSSLLERVYRLGR
jgi:thiopurine S-methyltransferase